MKIYLIAIVFSLIIIPGKAQLKVLSTGEVTIPINKSLWITNSASPSDNGYRLRMLNNGSNAYIDYYSNLYFRSGSTSSVNKVTFTTDGKVGIATTSPYSTFQVVGNSTFTQTTSSITSAAYIRGLNTYSTAASPDYTWYNNDQTGIFHPAGGTIGFSTGGTERAKIISNGFIYLEGHVGIGTYVSSNYNLYVSGDAYATDAWEGSDERMKKDIKRLETDFYKGILEINSYSYKFNEVNSSSGISVNESDTAVSLSIPAENLFDSSFYERTRIGLLAQEVKLVYPELVKEDENGLLAINYNGFIPILMDAIKSQQILILNLQSEMDSLKSGISATSALKSAFSPVTSQELELENENYLFQNTPNPFNEATRIRYIVPVIQNHAVINIYDLQGKQIRSFNISQTGEGEITISASSLFPGIYIYNLIVDGVEFDSKRMILTD